jgi:NADH:ubiquinone oxidoreductase subunit B-like Fe-S oxidoreductase
MKIEINGKSYEVEKLPPEGENLMRGIQFLQQKIADRRAEISAFEMSRQVMIRQLEALLQKLTTPPSDENGAIKY